MHRILKVNVPSLNWRGTSGTVEAITVRYPKTPPKAPQVQTLTALIASFYSVFFLDSVSVEASSGGGSNLMAPQNSSSRS